MFLRLVDGAQFLLGLIDGGAEQMFGSFQTLLEPFDVLILLAQLPSHVSHFLFHFSLLGSHLKPSSDTFMSTKAYF